MDHTTIAFTGSQTIPGVSGQTIAICGFSIQTNGPCTITLMDGASPSSTFGPFVFPSPGRVAFDIVPVLDAFMTTTAGNDLVISSNDASVIVSGDIWYSQS